MQRRSWFAVMVGGALLGFAGLVFLAGLGSAWQAGMTLGSLVAAVICAALPAAIGLFAIVWGLRPSDGGAAVAQATWQAAQTGGPVEVPANGTSVAQARDAFRGALGVAPNEVDREWDRAVDLLARGRYAEARIAYDTIANAHPERRADAYNSIGACLHLEGNYDEALRAYELARANGADARTIDENVAETRTAIAKRR